MRPIPDRAVSFVAQREGCVLRAYPDPASGGAPYTIGYGHTGPEVRLGLKITQEQATNYLRADLAIARARVAKRIGEVMDDLSEPQFCALLSFVLNLGDGDPKKPEWRIWKLLRARSFDQIPAELMRFTNAAGKPNKGLMNRRAAECALWASDAADEVLPSSVTRTTETPPTATAASALPDKTGLAVKIGTCVSACGLVVKQVSDTVAPYAAASPHLAQLIGFLAIAGAALAVLALTVDHMKKKHA